jgi:hypothetical protein
MSARAAYLKGLTGEQCSSGILTTARVPLGKCLPGSKVILYSGLLPGTLLLNWIVLFHMRWWPSIHFKIFKYENNFKSKNKHDAATSRTYSHLYIFIFIIIYYIILYLQYLMRPSGGLPLTSVSSYPQKNLHKIHCTRTGYTYCELHTLQWKKASKSHLAILVL